MHAVGAHPLHGREQALHRRGVGGGAQLEDLPLHDARPHVLQQVGEETTSHSVFSFRYLGTLSLPYSSHKPLPVSSTSPSLTSTRLAWVVGAFMCIVTTISCLSFVIGTAPGFRLATSLSSFRNHVQE